MFTGLTWPWAVCDPGGPIYHVTCVHVYTRVASHSRLHMFGIMELICHAPAHHQTQTHYGLIQQLSFRFTLKIWTGQKNVVKSFVLDKMLSDSPQVIKPGL